jgi:aminocarboxymuconate-semialdehyde decarboxylase
VPDAAGANSRGVGVRGGRVPDRRDFLKGLACASAGTFLLSRCCVAEPRAYAAPQNAGSAAGKRLEVVIAGKRVRTIDTHCHVMIPEAIDMVKAAPSEQAAKAAIAAIAIPTNAAPELFGLTPVRIETMDREGIDVQVFSVNAFWYSVERDLATRLVDLQNQKLAELCRTNPERYKAFASVALQFPDLAARQMEEGIKKYGLSGVAIGGSVEGQELSDRKFDPFWAKAEELQALVFMHPQDSANATGIAKRARGSGVLANVIGNPLETTLFLSHMIMEGVLDRFPNLKILAAHGGGYLGSYADRLDHGCSVFPTQCTVTLKKKPTEYLRQIYVDSIVFTPEALRHLVAVFGAGQIVSGTDYPYLWTTTPVDLVMNTPGLSDADRIAMLGDTAAKLLKMNSA